MATQTQTGGAALEATPASLSRQTTIDMPPAAADMDVHAKKGWDFFTKFLLWNVITIAVILVFIGFLTVWN